MAPSAPLPAVSSLAPVMLWVKRLFLNVRFSAKPDSDQKPMSLPACSAIVEEYENWQSSTMEFGDLTTTWPQAWKQQRRIAVPEPIRLSEVTASAIFRGSSCWNTTS